MDPSAWSRKARWYRRESEAPSEGIRAPLLALPRRQCEAEILSGTKRGGRVEKRAHGLIGSAIGRFLQALVLVRSNHDGHVPPALGHALRPLSNLEHQLRKPSFRVGDTPARHGHLVS